MKTTLLLFYLFFIPCIAFTQCNEFTKKECIPLLSPYSFNGQFNNGVLGEGEIAELHLTFHKDQEYRILVKGEDNLCKPQFQVLDSDRKILYTNADKNFLNTFDFEVESTDNFIIRVQVPVDNANDTFESGCVSILVGFRAFGSRTIFK